MTTYRILAQGIRWRLATTYNPNTLSLLADGDGEANNPTYLTRAHARALRDALDEWLAAGAETTEANSK